MQIWPRDRIQTIIPTHKVQSHHLLLYTCHHSLSSTKHKDNTSLLVLRTVCSNMRGVPTNETARVLWSKPETILCWHLTWVPGKWPRCVWCARTPSRCHERLHNLHKASELIKFVAFFLRWLVVCAFIFPM